MSPRWKGKVSEQIALGDPMSKIVQNLQLSLIKSQSLATLCGEVVLFEAEPEQADLLNRAFFGRQIITAAKDSKLWFQLRLEEAYYLSTSLNCLTIYEASNILQDPIATGKLMKDRQSTFPMLYKAYSHLRRKNWVVRPGSQYGVDFVVYRHHPALVHSEYAVLVRWDGDDELGTVRLRAWSDWHCMLRLCGSVAKSLLVLSISGVGNSSGIFPSCLDEWEVEEKLIGRWIAERNRDGEVPLKEDFECCDKSTPNASICIDRVVKDGDLGELPLSQTDTHAIIPVENI